MTQRSIKLFIVDDHEIVLDGLKAILNPYSLTHQDAQAAEKAPFQIVGVASSGEDLLERIAAMKEVDVVVSDYLMKNMNGIEAALRLKQIHPQVKVVLFSMYDSDALIQEAFAANVDGYVTKGEGRNRLIEVIKKVHAGERVFPALKKSVAPLGQAAPVKHILSKREIEIAALIAEGHTSQQIADALNIAFNTVEVHRANIYKKLKINKLADLVKYVLGEGIGKSY